MKAIKLLGLATGLIIVAGVGYLGYFLKTVAPMASGFAAHALCGNLFIAERQFEDIEKLDLPAIQQRLTRSVVDGHAVSTDFGIWPVSYTSVSVYRPGLGCGQLAGGTLTDLEGPASIERALPERQSNALAFAASFPVTTEPGTRWAYQTASSVLLGRVIRETLTDDDAYYHFAQQELFNRLGARNSHYQADGAGNYVGGAFLYATPRDWVRFGLLYLNDGVFAGQRILPAGWVAYSTTPTSASLEARAYGQSVIIIPSRQLVVVRMGQTFNPGAWDTETFLIELLDALPT